jgi:sulfate permease, SulP family
VVLIGVEQGILLAIALSLLRHVRHSYRPHTAVLVEEQGQWRPLPAAAGAVTAPGLVVFQFGADLFYANAERFATDVRVLVEGAAPPIKWLVLDAGAITGIDYSAGNMLRDLHQELLGRGTLLLLAHVTASLRADLTRHRLSDVIGTEHIFDTLHEALAAIREERVRSAPMPAAAQIAR